MPSDKAPHEFPNVKAKLQKPTKQSAFEKQKAEAEAKRLREEAETAAVYQDFIKSFDREESGEGNNDDNGRRSAPYGSQGHLGPRSGFGGPSSVAGTSKRHFGAPNVKSGPGSLGPAPNSFTKKRSFQDMSRGSRDRQDEFDRTSLSVPKAFRTSDDEDEEMGDATDKAEERAIARPTLRLINLPSGTSQGAVKALLPSNLAVEAVNFQIPSGAPSSDKKSKVAIVTLSKETPANDIEAAVSSLQNQYLGFGHYLSLHRHLSSAVTSASALADLPGSASEAQPFGAKPVEQPSVPHNRQREFGFQRGFAPPSSYDNQMSNVSRASLLYVPVKPPDDIRQVRLINKVIERVLDHGPEFEALLMSRPEVQRDEKWSWIWNARSVGGVWYRWRLWEIVTSSGHGQKRPKYVPLFDGGHAWKVPEERLPFEYTTKIHEIVSDSEYNSSDDEDFDGEANRDQGEEKETSFLNPLEKAKLTHLLARLPPTISKLRKGDIARVTTFAITHASRGVEEVVDMMVSNVEKPFSTTMANSDRSQDKKDAGGQGAAAEENNTGDGQDVCAASLVALYAVSDILSSSSSSGVRHAWRFRQLFEVALRSRKVFEGLGMMAEKFNWGRLRAEKWKRSVNLVLSLWEGWCVFAAESQDHFVQSFENPPSAKVDDKPDEGQKKNKWKLVDHNQAQEKDPKTSSEPPLGQKDLTPQVRSPNEPMGEDDVGGEPIEDEDVVGEPIEEDDIEGEPIEEDDIEGEPIEEEDIEGEPIEEDDIEGEPIEEDDIEGGPTAEDGAGGHPLGQDELKPMGEETVQTGHASSHLHIAGDKGLADKVHLEESKSGPSSASRVDLSRPKAVGRKPRMRAVDMFADSDGSDGGS